MMKIDFKRHFAAWLLLSVLIPTMVVVSLHHHGNESDGGTAVCESCVHHVHHDGHLGDSSHDFHNCLLCQLHCLSYILPVVTVLAVMVTSGRTVYGMYAQSPVLRVCGIKKSRAPPFILSL